MLQDSFYHGATAIVGQGLLSIEDSPSHSNTPYSVEHLWTSDQPDAGISNWQHTTIITDRHPFPPAGFEPAASPSEGPQTHALVRAASGLRRVRILHKLEGTWHYALVLECFLTC